MMLVVPNFTAPFPLTVINPQSAVALRTPAECKLPSRFNQWSVNIFTVAQPSSEERRPASHEVANKAPRK
jgi:hypothetical protein